MGRGGAVLIRLPTGIFQEKKKGEEGAKLRRLIRCEVARGHKRDSRRSPRKKRVLRKDRLAVNLALASEGRARWEEKKGKTKRRRLIIRANG